MFAMNPQTFTDVYDVDCDIIEPSNLTEMVPVTDTEDTALGRSPSLHTGLLDRGRLLLT